MAKVSDYTPAQIEQGIAEALKGRDFPAVVPLLKMLACRDPYRAKVVYESMTAVLDIMSAARGGFRMNEPVTGREWGRLTQPRRP